MREVQPMIRLDRSSRVGFILSARRDQSPRSNSGGDRAKLSTGRQSGRPSVAGVYKSLRGSSVVVVEGFIDRAEIVTGNFIDCDVQEDYPGFLTVARLRYDHGSEYRVTLSEHSGDELGVLSSLIPLHRTLIETVETNTFGNLCEVEATLCYWVME